MIFLCAFLLTLCLLAFLTSRDYFRPAFLQPASWLLASGLYALSLPRYNAPSAGLLALLGLGCLLFVCGESLGRFRSQRGALPLTRFVLRSPLALVLLGLLLLAYFGYAYTHAAALAGGMDNPFAGLRDSLVGDEGKAGSLGIGYIFPLACLLMFCLWTTRPLRRLAALAATALVFSLALLSTARTVAFAGLFVLVGALALGTPPHRRLRLGLLAVSLAIGLYAGFGVVLWKGYLPGTDLASAVGLMSSTILDYIVAPMPALDLQLQSTGGQQDLVLLRPFYALLSRLYPDVPVPALIQEWVYVPVGVNVYTFYYPYLQVGGWLLCLLAQFLLGILYGLLYRQASAGNPGWLFIYCFSLFPLVMQPFGDFFGTALKMWIGFSVTAIIASRLLGRDTAAPPVQP